DMSEDPTRNADALAGTLTPQPQFGRLTAPIEAGLRNWLRAPPPAPPAEQQDQVTNNGSAAATSGVTGEAAGGASAADRARPATSSAESRAAAGAHPGANPARRANDRSGSLVRPPPEPAAWSGPSLKQVGHFAVFTLLALAAFVAYGSVHPAAIAGYLLVFALATETMQLFLITRSARAMDLAVDGAGILLAWAALAALRAVSRGRWGRARRAARDAGP
ncbi:MAG: VanZ family protein, partial [Kiloniellaceae bacterium]